MGFDWQAFATGFLESKAKSINEAKKDAKDFEERQRTLAERNTKTISRRNAIATQVAGLTNMLRSNGASDTVIQAAISSGPQAITELANKVESARSEYGRDLNSSDIEALVRIPEGFNTIDLDTDAFIRQTYGRGYKGAGVSDKNVDQTFMDRLSGRKQMDLARARLDSEVMQDGLTAYDINQMAAQQEYESLVPGTFISFVDAKVFNPAKDMVNFTRTFSTLADAVMSTSEYSTLNSKVAQASRSTDGKTEEGETLSEVTAARDKLLINSVGPTIESYAATYGDSFTDAATGFLGQFLSPSYLASLSMDSEEPAGEEGPSAVPETVGQQTMDMLNATPLDEPATATGITVPKVTVTDLPAAETAEEPVVTEPVVEEEPESNSFLENVTTFLENATTLGSSKENAQTNLDNKARMQKAMANVTRKEWDAMSRAERVEAGLPKANKDRLFAGNDSFKQEEKEIVKTVKERAAERFGNIDPAKFDAAIEAGRLTELDLQVFADFGDDIMTYLKSNEYVGSEEDVLFGMSTWAQENGKTLPADKSFLVKTFLSAVEG